MSAATTSHGPASAGPLAWVQPELDLGPVVLDTETDYFERLERWS